jgi:uroporphyrin-III C-methyltransferase/precorrin-2 dehydrogenase/sirohydrochlorin ferrochelatase
VTALLHEFTEARQGRSGEGVVHIVGAGPGDADLLTLRALKVLRQADVVIHDRLIGPDILDCARPGAERVYVGKAKSRHSRPQAEINALMASQAAAGKRVVRLKGGDPFVFGRGGEEMEYLLSRGVRVEIVPGITAAAGCAAFAGIPLTHRDHAGAVTFITGHAKDGEPDLDWTALAAGRTTLVVYMGVSTAGTVARRLIENGMAASMPVAVIENGTLPTQKTVAGTLDRLEALIAGNDVTGPALIIIGDVVRAAAANCIPAWPLAAAE